MELARAGQALEEEGAEETEEGEGIRRPGVQRTKLKRGRFGGYSGTEEIEIDPTALNV